MAVGVSLKKENLDNFKTDINEYIKGLDIKEVNTIFNIDMEVTLRELTIEDVKELNSLEPFGEANETPNFIIKNLKIDSIRAITNGEHLKLRLKDDNFQIDAIGFHMGEYANIYRIGDKIDIIGNISINVYNGLESIQMCLKDISKSL